MTKVYSLASVGVLLLACAVWAHAALIVNSDGTLPDSTLTPGVVRSTDTDTVCNTRTGTIRNVPESMKERVRSRYNIKNKRDRWCNNPEGCEIDHLISLQLGGDNVAENLWPQPYQGKWNAHHKDALENRLRNLVCEKGTLTLEDAQKQIKTDWVAAYKKYISPTPKPISPRKIKNDDDN